MTPERISIEALMAARRMLEEARPDAVHRLLEDMYRFSVPGAEDRNGA